MTKYAAELDTAGAVLDFARTRRADADRAEADLLQSAVAWAAMHSADSSTTPPRSSDRYGDTGMPVAGEGAPLVAEFAITEFAAAIGVSTDAGKRYVGHALELLTGSRGSGAESSRVISGRGWRAGSRTRPSSSHPRPRRSWTATSRTWRTRSDPSSSNGSWRGDRDVHAGAGRGTPVGEGGRPVLHRRAAAISYAGTAAVHGELDLADALDLEQAVAGLAAQLKELGSEDSLNVRRAAAVGSSPATSSPST